MKCVLDRVAFTGFIIRSVFRANSHLAQVMSVRFLAWPRVCAVLSEAPKQAVNLSVHQDGRHLSTEIPKILNTEASVAEILVIPSRMNAQKQLL
jgi:hypothetical protein